MALLDYVPVGIALPDTTEITQLEELEPERGFIPLTAFSAAAANPQLIGSHGSSPMLPFRSPQIHDILDQIDIEGVAADLSAGNTDIQWKLRANRGSRVSAASSSHLRGRLTSNAFLCWESFSAAQDQVAEITCRLKPVWDGTNDPIIFSAGVTSTITDAVSAVFSLGPVKLNSSTLEGVLAVEWDNGNSYRDIRSDGAQFDTFGSIDRISPVLRITTTNKSAMATYGNAGTALSSLTVYLRKRAAGGFSVANGTAEHIAFTSSSGMIRATNPTTIEVAMASFSFDTTSTIT